MTKTVRAFDDTECYQDYWLFMLMLDNGQTATFEHYEGHPLDIPRLRRVLEDPRIEHYTFNGNGYDEFQIRYALAGATPQQLKVTSDLLIVKDPITKKPKYRPWELEKLYSIAPLNWNHVDLKEVAPGMGSLKIYGGRLHCQRMQDLPIEPSALICDESPMIVDGVEVTDPALKRKAMRSYCGNDLFTTKGLADGLEENLMLRRVMMEDIPTDLRSKSDAQIAEAVLKHKVFTATGLTPRKTPIAYKEFQYVPPAHVRFATKPLQEALETIREAKFEVNQTTGHVEMPDSLEKLVIQIDKLKLKLGLGGIHSQESEVSHYANPGTIVWDIDARSYYPKMILNMGMYPDSMGKHFLHAYEGILVDRLAAKDAGEKVKDGTLKITLNGTFGKTSSKYSVLYNPKMMIYTTITGQLNILMLIEALMRFDIEVVSANTDGIVVKTSEANVAKLRKIVKVWEKVTNLETEETHYRSIHARDVNSYVAIKEDGKVKTKGFFAVGGLQKNPQNEICVDALIAFLKDGKPFEHTIWDCKDIRKFVTIRTVDGGAFKEGYVMGKAIRWYYAKGETGVITYKSNGNTVPRSEGAKPLMELPEEFPKDVDYDWYVRECYELLMDIGVKPRPPKQKLPRKNSKEWKEWVEKGWIEPEKNVYIGPPRDPETT